MINKHTFLSLISQQMLAKNPPEEMRDLADLAIAFGKFLGMNKANLETIEVGSYIHDIGKLLIPDDVLRHPGPLNPIQWEIMRSHAVVGYDMVRNIPGIEKAALVTKYHHERYNGSGYPYSLKGEEIPFIVQAFVLCDVWMALRSKRVYKPSWTHEESINVLLYERDCGLYDSALADRFIDFVGHYVQSNSSKVKVVVKAL